MNPEYQSTTKYNSFLISMVEEGRNNQSKYNHQESHGLDVLINKGVSITFMSFSMLQATHHLLQMEFLEQRIWKVNSLGEAEEIFHSRHGLPSNTQ